MIDCQVVWNGSLERAWAREIQRPAPRLSDGPRPRGWVRQAIATAMQDGQVWTSRALAAETGCSLHLTQTTLCTLKHFGLVQRVGTPVAHRLMEPAQYRWIGD